jgi:Ca-activated chloride channel family protein
VFAAIDRFRLQRGTTIGAGLLVSLATLFPDQHSNLSGADPRNLPRAQQSQDAQAPDVTSVPPGSYESAAIILLTDGQNTTGPDPMKAAQMAASRGVKVFTVGFGTKDGEIIAMDGWSVRVRIDEDTLKNIANPTHGEYFHAGSGTDLKKVYSALRSRLVLERKELEITALFAYAAALLMLAGFGLSVWWFGRVA